jgi:hypothetical protein
MSQHQLKILVSEHAQLLNGGFPEPMTENFWSKVNELPETDQRQVRKLCELAEAVKRNLSSSMTK